VDKTCAQYFGGYPGATGSQGHETQDARQFAAWGVDYLKYDWCSPNGTIDDQVRTFAVMRDALAATGRPIVFSINPNSIHGQDRAAAQLGRCVEHVADHRGHHQQVGHRQTNGYPMGIQNIVNVTVPLASTPDRGTSTTRT